MLAVLLAVALIAPAADTSVRVPGTTLRFGAADSALAARGFARAKGGALAGRCRFFGLVSEATLEIQGGRLAKAAFRVDSASAAEVAYVQDQLTAMGYHRRCERLDPASSACDWTGRARLHVEVGDGALTAEVSPPEPPAAPVASAPATTPSTAPAAPEPIAALDGATAPARARAARAAAPTPALEPDTLVVAAPGAPAGHAAATVLRPAAPQYPKAARDAGIQGRVWVLAHVDTDGRVLEAAARSGPGELRAAAVDAVRAMRFEPRAWKGAPCRFRVLVPVVFTLH